MSKLDRILSSEAGSVEPYMGIAKYQPLDTFSKKQHKYWTDLPMKDRVKIRNGTAKGMSKRQLSPNFNKTTGNFSWVKGFTGPTKGTRMN